MHSSIRNLPAFLATSILLVAAPLPVLIVLTYRTSGWTEALAVLATWLGLAILYWWPAGAFLRYWKGERWWYRTWVRIPLGYLLSVPLYFLSLWMVYPAFGSAFHPLVEGRWSIYLSATPTFYVLVLLLYWLTTFRIAAWFARAAVVVLAVGMVLPLYFISATSLNWPRAASNHVEIAGAHIVDAPSDRTIEGQSVYVENGRILEIAGPSLHPGWPRIEAEGQYLVPGLIDVHTHLQSPVEVRAGFQFGYFFTSMMSNYAPQRRAYLASGVTTIRDLGGPATQSFQMRADIERRKMLGPHLLTAGRLVTSPLGHPVSTIWQASVSRQGAILAADERSMLDGLERNLAQGPPDAVKFVHGTIGRAKEELSVELLTRGIRWSKEHGLISVVHAETAAETEDAIRAGATGVEHSASMEALPESIVTLLAQTHTFMDPTFGEYATSLALQKKDIALTDKYRLVRELARAGARLVIGTDAPLVPYGTGYHDELAHFVRAGFSPAETLTFATVNNAAYLGKSNELGKIAAGYRADLILAKDNPLQELGTLRHPVWTMLDGQIIWP